MAKKLSASSQRAAPGSMSSEDIKNKRWTEKERQTLRRIAHRQAAGDDSHINYEDIPRLTKAQLDSMVRRRDVQRKVAVSVRLDPRVLDWLKSKGQGHLTRINHILVNLMEADHSADSIKAARESYWSVPLIDRFQPRHEIPVVELQRPLHITGVIRGKS